ncbi:MAG: 30S ribosomal protein S20 [Desulfovibrionaceae bacterium]|nr:30S ribosomal protein S20 [Desulfovibrionaceae bacterium]
MANHKSAIKRHKQSLKQAARNRAARTRVKNVIKDVRSAIQAQNKEEAAKALSVATSVLDKAAGKGAIHWKKAARKISRLSRTINAIEA